VAIPDAKTFDFRDMLISLGLLDHATREIRADADALFLGAASLAQPATSELILGYLNRAPRDRRLDRWGYVQVETQAGAGLLHWRWSPYKPTYPLDQIALALADVMRQDGYHVTSISLASNLPDVWLSSIGDSDLIRALRAIALWAVRAGVSIVGCPRSRARTSPGSLIVFVEELGAFTAVRLLLWLSREKQKKENDFVFTSFSEGRLFCMVIGREPTETQTDVQRFSADFSHVLRFYVDGQTGVPLRT
jgi:hypothetical protein